MARTLKNDGSNQLFAPGTTVTPVYGLGARTYGGPNIRGRTAQVQFREQNSGMAPSEDYSPAKFLPGLWRDLDRNGCPYVIPGGTVVGVAGVRGVSGEAEYVLSHQVMPANAGVPQKLTYALDPDAGIAIDLDSMTHPDTEAYITAQSRVSVAGDTSCAVIGNKPLAYTPTNVLSVAWSDVYANQKFEQNTTMKTQWLCMYPCTDRFMYGGVVTTDTNAVTVDSLGSAAVPSSTRAGLGFASVTVGGAAITLAGISAGDYVMPNPYLPGKLISVDDFVTLVVKDTAGTIYANGLSGFMIATAGDDTYAQARAYAMDHVVGRCFKRQSRAEVDGSGNVSNKDVYADVLSYLVQIPQLNLQGQTSSGIEANQEDALQFAKAKGNMGIDVVFINFNIK